MPTFTRTVPALTERSGEYWRSGADGLMRIATCQSCRFLIHPPRPVCPKCRKAEIRFEPVSGKGVIYSWTLNLYALSPSMPPPYVIADVELVEQPGLRLLTNIVDCDPDKIYVGMPVTVTFDQAGEAYIPVFHP